MENILMRLGQIISGSNGDFLAPSNEGEGSGSGDGEESEETQDKTKGEGNSSDSDDSSESEEDSTGSGDDAEDTDEESDESEGSEGEDSDEESDEDSEGDGEGEESDSDEDGSDSDSDSDGESDDDGDTDGEDGDEGEDEGNDSKSDDGDTDSDNSTEAGGETGDTTEKEIGDSLLEAMEEGEGTGLTNNNSALEDALEGKKEDDHCEANEQVWRPYAPSLDEVAFVRARNDAKAKRLQNQVKKEIAYLTNKMRSKFLQARSPQVIHGVRHGRELSERRLVESVTEIRSGRRPTRPDWTRVNKPECSLAVAVVLDQSGSMSGDEANVARAALAIATPMDKLGCSCLVVGPRSGRYNHSSTNDDYYGFNERTGRRTYDKYHRDGGVRIDVFKNWEEPMRKALPRFSSVQATGGTPLSDGIQYAMQELSGRPERHRVIIVLTDGCPNCPAVVRRQIRLAKEAGVTIVGVGISSGCYQVTSQFPENHVAVTCIADLPRNMLAVLDAILFPNRAKRIKLDGKLSGAKLRAC